MFPHGETVTILTPAAVTDPYSGQLTDDLNRSGVSGP